MPRGRKERFFGKLVFNYLLFQNITQFWFILQKNKIYLVGSDT